MEDKIGKQVGVGGTSMVYEWGNSEVIKIFKPQVRDNVIDNEKFIEQLLNRYSLNIPKYVGTHDYNGNRALIYERINGNIMAEPQC